jgi:hypothetical protein
MLGIRNLTSLATSASTSRVLNLHLIAKRYTKDPLHKKSPLFTDYLLNRSILVKHRLRRDEVYLVPSSGGIATKIIFPFDCDDLEFAQSKSQVCDTCIDVMSVNSGFSARTLKFFNEPIFE